MINLKKLFVGILTITSLFFTVSCSEDTAVNEIIEEDLIESPMDSEDPTINPIDSETPVDSVDPTMDPVNPETPMDSEDPTIDPVDSETPVDSEDPTDSVDDVSDFIPTNDGSFDLEDFQIESSSHLTSTTSTSTTSWEAVDSSSAILATEWYTLLDGDYYLKSASNDGKRTEWKEYPGKETSLDVNKTMTYEASITEIPENGVTIAQMHNRFKDSDSYRTRRPFLRVYIEDGKIRVKKTNNDLTNTSGSYDSTTVGPSVSEGEKFKVQLITGSEKVNVKVETSSGTLDKDFYPNTEGSYKDYKDYFYFKAGVYTEGDDTEPIIRFYSFEN